MLILRASKKFFASCMGPWPTRILKMLGGHFCASIGFCLLFPIVGSEPQQHVIYFIVSDVIIM